MKKVPAAKVVTAVEAAESPLPVQIQEALGELVGAAREGLLALSVGVGLGIVHELMEAEVDEVVGPKGRHNPDRVAVRHGHEDGSMTLGGRRVAVRRPRMRSGDDEREVPVQTYGYFADRDPLTRGERGPPRRRTDAAPRGRRLVCAVGWRVELIGSLPSSRSSRKIDRSIRSTLTGHSAGQTHPPDAECRPVLLADNGLCAIRRPPFTQHSAARRV